MSSYFEPTYNAGRRAGTSGAELSDRNPERAYDTDIRRLDDDSQAIADRADTRNLRQQDRVRQFMASAKAAGKYRQKAQLDEPQIRGRTPRTEASIAGVTLPSQGDTIGSAGHSAYARKPGFGSSFA